MTDKKFTDEEIVKALECCQSVAMDDCDGCPYSGLGQSLADGGGYKSCCNFLLEDALSLIDRKKAEIERLNNAMDVMVVEGNRLVRETRAEAIEEFAERVYGLIEDADDVNPVSYCAVDKIAKELTEVKQ